MRKIYILLSLLMLLFAGCGTSVAIVPDTIKINSSGENAVDVKLKNNFVEAISFFLTKPLQYSSITQDINLDDKTIYVVDTTNCFPYDAVDVYDNNKYYQGLIESVTSNSITIKGEFTQSFNVIDTEIKCGEWDLSTTDGSSGEELFSITPPSNQSWHILTTIIKITDNSDWDLSGFGGGPRLNNGISGRISDGYKKDLFLIQDNSGFKLRGFQLENFEKAPSGVYGFVGTLNFNEVFGSIIELNGDTDDTWSAVNRDDFTGLTEVSITINGHLAEKE